MENQKKTSVLSLIISIVLSSDAFSASLPTTNPADETNTLLGENAQVVILPGTHAAALPQFGTAIGWNAKANKSGISIGSSANAVAGSEGNIQSAAVSIGSNSAATAQSAIALGSTSKASGSLSIAIGTTSNATAGSAIALGADSSAEGHASVAIGPESTATGSNSIAIGQKSKAIRDFSVSFGFNTPDGSSVSRVLTHVSAGTEDTDGVNVKQLTTAKNTAVLESRDYTNNSIINNNIATNKAIELAKTDAVSEANNYTNEKIKVTSDIINQSIVSSEQRSVTNANKYTDSKISDYNKVVTNNITNSKVESVKESNDYTNKKVNEKDNEFNKKINNAKQQAINTSNQYTDYRISNITVGALNDANRYTDSKISKLKDYVNASVNKLNGGIAGVTALSSIPYCNDRGVFSYGLGVGNYANANAVAIGGQYNLSSKARLRINLALDSTGNDTVGLGMSGNW